MKLADYKFITKNGMWVITSLIGKKSGDYVYARVVDHPSSSSAGYILEHRVVMENYLGRMLGWDEIVKHLDGNTKNNKIENLIAIKWSEASKIFGVTKTKYSIKCPNCKTVFDREARIVNRYKRMSQLTFCTRRCSSAFSRVSRDEIKIDDFILSVGKYSSMTLKDAKTVIYGSDLKAKKKIDQSTFYELSEPRKLLKEIKCLFCESHFKPMTSKQKYCSDNCAHHGTRKFHISNRDLHKLVKRHSFLYVGRKLGVSDNAVRKRCKKLGILIRNDNKWQIKESYVE